MWFSNLFSNQITANIISTIASVVLLAIVGIGIYLFVKSRYDQQRQHVKLKRRIAYVMFVIALLVIAKIWIQGFTHFFTVLGLIAVGLTVANKESIMNLVGWLIINWRGLFTEGDFVKIGNNSGFIHAIGPLYFRLYEADELSISYSSGKSIKIPNGLVITTPVTSYSIDNNLCRYTISASIELNKNLESSAAALKEIIQEILDQQYKDDRHYSIAYVRAHSRILSQHINLEPSVKKLITDTQTNGVCIKTSFYCFPKDYKDIENAYWSQLFKMHLDGNIELITAHPIHT